MIKKYILSVFVITFILFSQSFSQSFEPNVLAVVDTQEIYSEDFLSRYTDYLFSTGINDNLIIRESILNNMINEMLLYHYDDNRNIFTNPEYQKEIEWANNETVLAFLKDSEIYANITASDDEVREAFRRSQTKLAVRHLYAPTLESADNLYNLLKSGKDFNELARQVFTDSILSNNGGYLGYISWGQTDPSFENAAYSLKIGEISEPVKTAQGYSIIRVDDKIVNPMITENEFKVMKNKITRAVKIDKKNPAEKSYLEKIFGKDEVRFNDNVVENIFRKVQNNQSINDPELNNNTKEGGRECLNYNGKSFTQTDIEDLLSKTPNYNLNKITDIKKTKEAILGLLMQEKLLDIAHQKGYDTTSYVLNTIKKLNNNIFINYKREEIINNISIPDSVLISYYNNNIDYFKSENEMNIKEIILSDSLMVKKVKTLINKGEDFAQLAEKYSIRKLTSKNKGEIGLAPVSKFGEIKDTLWNSPVGNVIGPLKFVNYYGFFKVIKKQDGKPLSYDIVKPQVLKAVKYEQGFTYMKKHIESLLKKINVRINTELLKNYNFNLAG